MGSIIPTEVDLFRLQAKKGIGPSVAPTIVSYHLDFVDHSNVILRLLVTHFHSASRVSRIELYKLFLASHHVALDAVVAKFLGHLPGQHPQRRKVNASFSLDKSVESVLRLPRVGRSHVIDNFPL